MIQLLSLIQAANAQQTIVDGSTIWGSIDYPMGGQDRYIFQAPTNPNRSKDLAFTLTSYSDQGDPNLYVSVQNDPTADDFDFVSNAVGMDSIVIKGEEVVKWAEYRILVQCSSYCRYALTVSFTSEKDITLGSPLQGMLQEGAVDVFTYTAVEEQQVLDLLVFAQIGDVLVRAAINEEPSSNNSVEIVSSWSTGYTALIEGLMPGDVLYVSIAGVGQTTYTILLTSDQTIVQLQAAKPIQDEVSEGEMRKYKIYVSSPQDNLSILVTPFTGDPDIYVTRDPQSNFLTSQYKSVSYGNETLVISSHDRESMGNSTGWFYIGVYGYSHSLYTIRAQMNQGSQVPLLPGISQVGYADYHETDLYYLEIPKGSNFNVTVTLSVMSGNPDLYGKLCVAQLDTQACRFKTQEIENPHDYSNIFVSEHETGDDSLKISHDKDKCSDDKPCLYIFGVYGKSNHKSEFIIVASYEDSVEHVLQASRSIRMSIPEGDSRYFKYSVYNETITDLTFQLTPISGDADMFISRSHLRPNIDNADKISNNNYDMQEVIKFVKGVDGDSLVGTYHLSIYAFQASQFTILALEQYPNRNVTVPLYPGLSQRDTVYNMNDADFRIYSFNVNFDRQRRETIKISLTPLSGRFDLYVANNVGNLDLEHDIFYYDWSNKNHTYTDRVNTLIIPADDSLYITPSTYLILVQSTEFADDDTASYYIRYTTGDNPIILNDNVPHNDELENGEFAYYVFSFSSSHEDITIRLNAQSGDPDLFISVTGSNTRPTQNSNDYMSSSFGSDFITILWEDKLKENCFDRSKPWNFGDPTHCNVYIGVLGYSHSVYTIMITGNTNLPTRVQYNIPIGGQLQNSEYAYYFVQLNQSKLTRISVESYEGDTDVYVNIIDMNQTGNSDKSNWIRPTKIQSDLKSEAGWTNDQVLITPTKLSEYQSNNLTALIGIFCFNGMCEYQLQIELGETFNVNEGEIIYDEVEEGMYKYFLYYNPNEEPFTVSVTTFADEKPIVYINKGQDNWPTQEQFTWKIDGFEVNKITIEKSDPEFQTTPMRGYFAIGVFGTTFTSYSLLVQKQETTLVWLDKGQPTTVQLQANETQYFIYYSAEQIDLDVTLTPVYGKMEIYINSAEQNTDYDRPSAQNFIWTGALSNSQYNINISTTDPFWCYQCYFLIAVQSKSESSKGTLVVSTRSGYTRLQSGIAQRGILEEGEWDFFVYEQLNETDIDISLTNYSGNPDIFIAIQPFDKEDPISSAKWKTESQHKVEHIHIGQEQNDQQKLYIGIQGKTHCSYALTAHGRHSYVQLISGWPATYNLVFHPRARLLFEYQLMQGLSYCKLVPFVYGFFPKVYVRYVSIDDKDAPNEANAELKFEQEDYNEVYNYLKFDLPPKDVRPGKYLIAIYGTERPDINSDIVGDFEFMCSRYQDTQILNAGQVDYAMLNQLRPSKRYEINVGNRGNLEVNAEPCIGRFELQISTNYTMDSTANPTINVSRISDGKVTANIQNAFGRYYVNVVMTEANEVLQSCSFSIYSILREAGSTYSQLVSGGEGLIHWEIDEDDLVIEWDPVEYENGTLYADEVEYFLFASRSQEIDMMTACQVLEASNWGKASLLKQTTQTQETIDIRKIEKSFNLNVIATVRGLDYVALQSIPYYPIQIQLDRRPPGPHGLGIFIIWAVSAIVFAALVTAFVFYKKYRKVQQRLEYEMSDVRNIAGIVSKHVDSDKLSAFADLPYEPLDSTS